MVLRDTMSSISQLFSHKYIAPKNHQLPVPNSILKSNYSFFPLCSLSPFMDSRTHRFKLILQHGPYNVSSIADFNKHGSEVLTKIGFCSIPRFGWKPENIFSNSIYDSFSTPSVASGISLLKKSSHVLLSCGALRHYHNYRRPPHAPKYYKKPTRIRRYIAPKKYSKLNRIWRFIKHVYNYRILYLVGVGIIPMVIFGRLETVPYTKRKHIMIIPPSTDKFLGDVVFDENELTILPSSHPDSVRVKSISNRILKALHTDLKFKGTHDMEYSLENVLFPTVDKKKEVQVPWWKEVLVPWRRLDKFSTRHLDGLKWQVVVVDSPRRNAYCLPGGKIVVYAGLLKHLKSDAQVATVIGHEVGHIVARHGTEIFTRELWIIIGRIIIWSLWEGIPPNHHITEKLRNIIAEFPWSRRNEKEADYIGLLLMASAGYDPREAPKVYRMFANNFGKSDSEHSAADDISDIFKTHPSGRKRAGELSKTEVMEEAMSRYTEVTETCKKEERFGK